MDILTDKTTKIKSYFRNVMGKKFGVEFTITDRAATCLALNNITGGNACIWLDGKEVPVKDIQISMDLIYRSNNTKSTQKQYGITIAESKEHITK